MYLKKNNPVFYFCLSSLPLTPLEPLVMAGGIKLVPCFLPVASPLEVKVSTLDRICGGYKVVAVKLADEACSVYVRARLGRLVMIPPECIFCKMGKFGVKCSAAV